MVTTLSKAGKNSVGLEDAEWKWRHSQSQSVSALDKGVGHLGKEPKHRVTICCSDTWTCCH